MKSLQNKPHLITSICLILLVTACSSTRPVLYANSHYESVSMDVVNQDINECMRLANESGAAGNKSGEIAKGTAENAAVGGAAGAAAGAVYGNVGRGAAAGAAAAGAATVMRGILRSDDPDPVYKAYVNRCLRERGYEPVGWK